MRAAKRFRRGLRVWTLAGDLEGGPAGGCEHHHAHDAFSVGGFFRISVGDRNGVASKRLAVCTKGIASRHEALSD